MPRKIRGVVFDLDNTLIKSRQGSIHALRLVSEIISRHLSKKGFVYKKSDLLTRLRRIESDRRASRSMLAPRVLYDRDEWWKTLLKQLRLERLSGPWIRRTTMQYWDAYMKASPPFSDAESSLKRLRRRGIRLAVVSDSDGTRGVKRKRVRRLSFHKLFETVIVAGEDTPMVKPSKGPFLLVARRLRVPPAQCTYVGDNPTTDIEGAKATGMLTVLVKRRKYMVLGGLRASRPNYLVSSLREIPRVLEKIEIGH